MRLKYTDVDYNVFSDAAIHVTRGESPYRRDTYRYTPLLAFMLTPNVLIHPVFGKVLFCIFDVAAGYLMFAILRLRRVSCTRAMLASSLWLFNPLPLAVSSRGNAEAVLATLVLAVIYCIMKRNVIAAAVLYGLAVHVKTYPIIYAPSIYLLLNVAYKRPSVKQSAGAWQRFVEPLVPSKQCLAFAFVSVSIVALTTLSFYMLYGEEFLMETYWYHVTRKDLQHNFSIYFYLLRLAENTGPTVSTAVGLAAFIPQALAMVVFSVWYYRDLPFAWFIITAAFVTFNKVCTSQYFLWYLCLLPLILPQLSLAVREGMLMCLIWFAAQGAWLLPAYYYEFEKKDVLVYVWLASVAFMLTNIWCICKIVNSASTVPIFDNHGRAGHAQAATPPADVKKRR